MARLRPWGVMQSSRAAAEKLPKRHSSAKYLQIRLSIAAPLAVRRLAPNAYRVGAGSLRKTQQARPRPTLCKDGSTAGP